MDSHFTLVTGLGGAGCEVAHACASQLHLDALYINSDARHLERWPRDRRLFLSGPTSPPSAIAITACAAAPAFVSHIGSRTHVIIFAGLGGRTGTQALAALARAATSHGCAVLLAVTTPFDVETERVRIAQRALASLRADGFSLSVYDHSSGQANQPAASMQDLLDTAADNLIEHGRLWIEQAARATESPAQ